MIATRSIAVLGAAALAVACGSPSTSSSVTAGASSASAPCGELEAMRPRIYAEKRKELDYFVDTRDRPAQQKNEVAEAFVTAFLSRCAEDGWSLEEVNCFVAGYDAGETRKSKCARGVAARVSARYDETDDATYTRFFGPRPKNDLDKFGEKQEQIAAEKAACKAKASGSSGAPPAGPGLEPRSTIPARYVGLAWFSRAAAPLFQRIPGGAPPCVGQVLATVDGYYMASVIGSAPSLIAVRGIVDRDEAEACLKAITRRWSPDAQVERDGVITRITVGSGTSYLGWAADDRTVYSNADRSVVEEALAEKTTIRSNAPVMALLARVDRCKSVWFVQVADFTSKFIGVPSTSVLFANDLLSSEQKLTADTMPRIPVTIEFDSPEDAKRAVAAIRVPHKGLSQALNDVLGKLAPVAHGHDVEIDIAPIFSSNASHPELMSEMSAAITRVREAR
jgi:hypothetical protein